MTEFEAISQLLYRYCRAFDDGDIDTAMTSFTADAILRTPSSEAQRSDGRPHDPNFRAGGAPIAGLEAIRAYLTTGRQRRADLGWQPRHVVSNLHVVEDHGDEKTVQCYITFVVTEADGTTLIDHAGVLIDRVVKTADGWKFREHIIRIDADRNFLGRPPEGQVKRRH